MVMIIYLLLTIASLAILYKLIYHTFLHPGAIYYPSKPEVIETLIKHLKLKKDDLVIDLGSGDGRILFAFAHKGVKSIGYEINPFLAKKSQQVAQELDLDKLVTIYTQSMYNSDLSQATIIVLYQFPQYMKKLFSHIQKSITKPVTIVSNDYEFPGLLPFKTVNKIYYYHVDPLSL